MKSAFTRLHCAWSKDVRLCDKLEGYIGTDTLY